MADDTSPSGGILTAGQRMERIEDAVLRIESKLDAKADAAALRPIEQRIQLIESGETPLGRIMLEQFRGMVSAVTELQSHGSKEAQEALRRITLADTEIENLKSANLSRRAEDKQMAVTSDRHYRLMAFIVSIAVVLLMVVQIVTVFVPH